MTSAQAHNTKAETFEKRLRAYAVGAGAAAAGLLSFSPPATAQIVVVPAHATLQGGGSPFSISIEGTTEFTLVDNYHYYGYAKSNSLVVSAASGAGAVGHGRSPQVAPLKFGAVIGSADQFAAGKQRLARAIESRFLNYVSGPFANTANRFLGLKFELNGQVYYGWAGFSVVSAYGRTVTASLTAYAYETTPNKGIYAGQSSDLPAESRLLPSSGSPKETATVQPTLGLLALGSIGLDAWRKRETQDQAAGRSNR